jgi:hypothetical protein
MRNRPTRQTGGSRRTATGADAASETTRYADKECARCGAPFTPSGGRQRYCDYCRLPKFRMERNREAQERHRQGPTVPPSIIVVSPGRYYVRVRLRDRPSIGAPVAQRSREDYHSIDLRRVPVSYLVIKDAVPETLDEALEWERSKDRHIRAGQSHTEACRLAWSEQLEQLAGEANDDRWGDSLPELTMTRSSGSDLRKRRPISTDSRSGGGSS